ncbi:hypothetical protein D5086_009594 [Populus alba]|uniref:Uncharacterized protein n=1 Tax=Populus alba TaxID=43335 RepID=A0ACC4CKG8_POPAL
MQGTESGEVTCSRSSLDIVARRFGRSKTLFHKINSISAPCPRSPDLGSASDSLTVASTHALSYTFTTPFEAAMDNKVPQMVSTPLDPQLWLQSQASCQQYL